MDKSEQYRGCKRSGGRSEWARLPLDSSLRAKRSNLQGAVTIKGGDCFVTLFLAMTSPERLPCISLSVLISSYVLILPPESVKVHRLAVTNPAWSRVCGVLHVLASAADSRE